MGRQSGEIGEGAKGRHMKKKILVTYYSMVIGGSTTSLLSLLNCIDKSKYEVDLQLYRHDGPLFQYIPQGVNILPPACKEVGKAQKYAKFLLHGFWKKALLVNRNLGKKGFSQQVLSQFQVQELSKPLDNVVYDFALGFVEGWSDYYLAHRVKANKKYGWYHSTFENAAPNAALEFDWIEKVDNIVFVVDACTSSFKKILPQYQAKAITVSNILDSSIVKQRSLEAVDDPILARMKGFKGMRIITVCRTDIHTKGLDRIVNCAKQLKEEGHKFIWFILGDGPGQSELKQQIAESDVEDVLVLMGIRLNPYPYVRACDVFCLASRIEGKPITITEAQMLGVVPVVTEYMSAHSQILDKTDGLIARNDDVDIINKVRYCIEHPETVEKMKRYLYTHEYGNKDYIKTIEDTLLS